jgi:hypothetical protein
MLLNVVAVLAGTLLVFGALLSALRTIVVPRAERVHLSRAVGMGSRWCFKQFSKLASTEMRREAIKARGAPLGLVALPAIWAAQVAFGFSLIFWGLDVKPYRDALVLSGSSLTTLGFRSTDDLPTLVLAVLEALLGLGLIALLITFLPTIYGHFSKREALVTRWYMRAGSPPSIDGLLIRAQRIGWLGELQETWSEWERWFVDLEEAHTSYPALNFFRSPSPDRSWIIAAGSVLDTAAFVEAAVDVPSSPQARLSIRSGYMALAAIGEMFDADSVVDPQPDDPISYGQAEFDAIFERCRNGGIPMVADIDQAWRDFAGWRVNYDSVLNSLLKMVDPPDPAKLPNSMRR